MTDRKAAGMLILLAGAMYAAHAPSTWVGYINDDAHYILLGQALLHGHYVSLALPDHPPVTTYPPVFPMLLAPIVWLVRPHWAWLKLVPMTLTLASGALLWNVLGTWLRGGARCLGLSLFLLNPLVLHHSSLLLAEPLFTVLLLSALIQFRRLMEHNDARDAWILGLIAGALVLTRSAGAIAIPIFAAALLWLGRRRDAVRFAWPSLAMAAAFPIRNAWLAGEASGYAINWKISLSGAAHVAPFLQHLNQLSNLLFVGGFLGIRLPYSTLGFVLNAALVAGVGVLLWMAFRSRPNRPSAGRATFGATIGLLAGWCALHALWATIEPHYAAPAMPLLAAGVAVGSGELWKIGPRARLACLLAGGLILGALTLRDIGVLRQDWAASRARTTCLPARTWRWINDNLPPNAFLLTAMDGQAALYTNRCAMSVLPSRDAAEFHDTLRRAGVTHILTRPRRMQYPGLDISFAWENDQRWTASNPGAYRLAYQNPDEATAVYEVRR
ncbi:MAG TPA: hypothetical protein VMU17_04660 [Elusimicrobiota bacterium]|nr:hypothetical protein [Elusimicrobiota bacterium]